MRWSRLVAWQECVCTCTGGYGCVQFRSQEPLGLAFPSWLPVHYAGFSTDTTGCTQCLIQLKSQLLWKKNNKPGHSCAYAMNIYVPQHLHSHMSFVPHQNKKASLSGVTVVVTNSPPFFYAARLFNHSKAGLKVLHLMKAILKRDQGQRCVCVGGVCVCEERCMEKKNRKAKNLGMLGFVCTAKNVLKAGKWGRV